MESAKPKVVETKAVCWERKSVKQPLCLFTGELLLLEMIVGLEVLAMFFFTLLADLVLGLCTEPARKRQCLFYYKAVC